MLKKDADYLAFASELYTEAIDLFAVANEEYAEGDHWTKNFDTITVMMRIAGLKEFKPHHAALCLGMKSLFSIAKNQSNRQSMRSRFLDVINYLTFIAWMYEKGHDIDLAHPLSVLQELVTDLDGETKEGHVVTEQSGLTMRDFSADKRTYGIHCQKCLEFVPADNQFFHPPGSSDNICGRCVATAIRENELTGVKPPKDPHQPL